MNQSNDSKSVKAAIWYTLSNFISKGLIFLTTPIFTRILTKSEFGIYSNYLTWRNLLIIIVTLELYSTVTRAKIDFDKDFDEYLSTITILGSLISVVFYVIVILNIEFVSSWINVSQLYIHVMFIYIITSSSLQILQVRNQVTFKYKSAAVLTFVSTGVSAIVSVGAALCLENRLLGRILGQELVLIIINTIIFIWIVYKGRSFNLKYIKYAIAFALPLVPHLLAGNLLGSFDRIAIDKMQGEEALAIYSLAYNCALLLNVLLDSLNQAMVPWLYSNINNNMNIVKKISNYYIGFFFYIAIGIMLIAPEIVYIFGGKEYMEAKFIMVPLVMGACFKIVYSMYVNIEMYEKKTFTISIGTLLAAGLNIPLNYIFIKQYGYIAAAYTTMVCYGFLMLFHYIIIRRLGKNKIYNNRLFIIFLTIMLVMTIVIVNILRFEFLRVILVILYFLMTIIVLSLNINKAKLIVKNVLQR